MKGFVAVGGKPMRLLVQAVGPRVSHYYDRAWGGGRGARQGRLVVIGLKGLDRERRRPRRCADRPCICSTTTASTPRRHRRTGRSRPDAGRYRGACRSPTATSPVSPRPGGGAASSAERAARASARSAPSDVGRSVDRQGGAPCQGDRGAAARRARLVALRRRPRWRRWHASGHRAGRAARRGPRRPAARSRLRPCPPTSLRRCSPISAKAGRENLQALLRRLAGHAGARRDQPRAAAACRAWPAICRAKARSASTRLPPRSRRDSRSCRSSSTARRCLPPTPRRSTRCARRWPRAGWRRRRW